MDLSVACRFALHSGSYFPSTSLSHMTPPGSKTVLQRIAHRHCLCDAEAERHSGPNSDKNVSQGRKLDCALQVPGFQRLFRIFHRSPQNPAVPAQEHPALCRTSPDGAAQIVQKPGWQLPPALFIEEPVGEAWDVHHFPEQWRGLQDAST